MDGETRRIRLTRIHMEEDAGKNVHDITAAGSGVDLNRAGVPLLEIVSEPDLRSIDEAIAYLKTLRAILMALGVNDGNLQEGSFRCDANVSVMPKGATRLGTRCELKNMNSFRFLRQAIDYEVRRQVELIEAGGKVEQETRLFDPDRGETRSMRSKEEAHDYRYFPEPDLPPVVVEDALVERIRGELPELPRARSARYQRDLGLSGQDAELLVADKGIADFFDATLAAYGSRAGRREARRELAERRHRPARERARRGARRLAHRARAARGDPAAPGRADDRRARREAGRGGGVPDRRGARRRGAGEGARAGVGRGGDRGARWTVSSPQARPRWSAIAAGTRSSSASSSGR